MLAFIRSTDWLMKSIRRLGLGFVLDFVIRVLIRIRYTVGRYNKGFLNVIIIIIHIICNLFIYVVYYFIFGDLLHKDGDTLILLSV